MLNLVISRKNLFPYFFLEHLLQSLYDVDASECFYIFT